MIRVPQYVGDMDQGLIVPKARAVVGRDSGVAALVDAHRGFGQHRRCSPSSGPWDGRGSTPLGWPPCGTRPHIGRLGEYGERTAAEGLIGIVTVGAGGTVSAASSRSAGGPPPRDEPVGLSVPGRSRRLIFDAATSTLAEGKVRVARAAGKPLPPDAIVDPAGHPSRDAEAFYAGGALLPLGGALAGHKGYGLGLASALLGALGMIGDAEPTLVGAAPPESTDDRGRIAGVFLEVIDPAAFGDPARYAELVDEALDAASASRPPTASPRFWCRASPRSAPARAGAARASRCRRRRGPSSGRWRPASACRCRRTSRAPERASLRPARARAAPAPGWPSSAPGAR